MDGFITFREAQRAAMQAPADAEMHDLSAAIDSLAGLCRQRDWTTEDPLGLGGLLFDACRLCQLMPEQRLDDVQLLQEIMEACGRGLFALSAARQLNRPLAHRLPFRELGLAIGLYGLPVIVATIMEFENRPALQRAVDRLLPYEPLADQIVRIWLSHARQPDTNWQAHQDINDVMLATALIPATFLSVGERAPVVDRHVRT